jgi:hypothetical protein
MWVRRQDVSERRWRTMGCDPHFQWESCKGTAGRASGFGDEGHGPSADGDCEEEVVRFVLAGCLWWGLE